MKFKEFIEEERVAKLVNPKIKSWFIVIHKSTKNPGKWQASLFEKGWKERSVAHGDTQHDSYEEAMKAQKKKGYKVIEKRI